MATETATPTEPVEPLDPVLSSMRSEIQLLIDKDFNWRVWYEFQSILYWLHYRYYRKTTIQYDDAESLHDFCLKIYEIGKANNKTLDIYIKYDTTYPIEIFNYWTLAPDTSLIALANYKSS